MLIKVYFSLKVFKTYGKVALVTRNIGIQFVNVFQSMEMSIAHSLHWSLPQSSLVKKYGHVNRIELGDLECDGIQKVIHNITMIQTSMSVYLML